MSKVYVVFGTTGEYSDYVEWPVCAFADEALAIRMVELCDGEWRRIKASPEYNDGIYVTNKYDPDMQTDYTGTRYNYYELELRDSIDEGDSNEQS